MEYLFSQTGKAFEEPSFHPDTAEADTVEPADEDDTDEGFQDVEDGTIPLLPELSILPSAPTASEPSTLAELLRKAQRQSSPRTSLPVPGQHSPQPGPSTQQSPPPSSPPAPSSPLQVQPPLVPSDEDPEVSIFPSS